MYGNEAGEIEALRYSLTKGQNHLDYAELYGASYIDENVAVVEVHLSDSNIKALDTVS